MNKIKNSKGFTLMEMLIVVAIIAILVAIAIPSFTSQLEKAREAADIANIRSAYAEAMANYLSKGSNETSAVAYTASKMTQSKSTWDYVEWPEYLGTKLNPVTKDKYVKVTVSDDATNGGMTVKCELSDTNTTNP